MNVQTIQSRLHHIINRHSLTLQQFMYICKNYVTFETVETSVSCHWFEGKQAYTKMYLKKKNTDCHLLRTDASYASQLRQIASHSQIFLVHYIMLLGPMLARHTETGVKSEVALKFNSGWKCESVITLPSRAWDRPQVLFKESYFDMSACTRALKK